MSKEKDALDFAGFKDAGVDLDAHENAQKADTAFSGNKVDNELSHTAQRSEKTTTRGTSGLFGWFVLMACVIVSLAVFSLGGRGGHEGQTVIPVPTPSTEKPSIPPRIEVGTTEQRPAIGTQRLTRAQLRWCVFWDARMTRLSQLVVDDPLFPAFNHLVKDYDARCIDAQYYETDMETIRGQLAVRGNEIEASANEIYRDWSQKYLAPVVHDIQASLTDLGYEPGPADGIIGPRTRNAIRQLERDYGLEPTGLASVALRDALQEIGEGQ